MNDTAQGLGHAVGVVLLAIISLAVLVVLFAPGSKTSDVISAAGRAFAGILAVVLAPITGGQNLGSIGSSLLQTASFGGSTDPLGILGGGGGGGGFDFAGFGGGSGGGGFGGSGIDLSTVAIAAFL